MGAGGELFKMAINPLYGVARLVKYFNKPDDPDNADFSQIANTVKGVWNDWTGNTANRENIDYQQEYNQQVFNRADTQYQRTVADLRSAGLSAQLAAGTPSTVAGASAAPQRTVGNESEAISRIVDLVNAIKQTNANVAVANAQIDESKAKTANISADTDMKLAELNNYPEKFEMDMAILKADLTYKQAMTFIAQQEGQTFMTKFQADLDHTIAQTNYQNKLIELADSEIELNGAKVAESGAIRNKIRAETEKLKQEKQNLVQDLTNKMKEGLRIDAQTALLLYQAVESKVNGEILQYNLDQSKENGLRTTDQISRFFGINLGLDSPLSKFSNWFRNYKGIGGLFPSWNEIFGGTSK